MAQAKKKPVARKKTVKKAEAKTTTRAAVRTKKPVATGHADAHAKSVFAWAVLGVVVIAFALWILTDYKNLQENFNNVNEGSSSNSTNVKKPDAHSKDMQN